MNQNLVLITPSELQTLIQNAVNVAVQQLNLTQKAAPLSESKYLTLGQACAYLHIAPQTMYALTSKRKIKFIKAFKSLLFTQADLDEYLAMNRKETKHSILNSPNLGKKKEVKYAA